LLDGDRFLDGQVDIELDAIRMMRVIELVTVRGEC
jgi:hypothetical protein